MKCHPRKKELKTGVAWYPTIKHQGKQYSFGGWSTRKAAQARGDKIIELVAANASTPEEESRVLRQLKDGTFRPERESLLFEDYYNRWFESKRDWKDSTRKSYELTFRLHILPHFTGRYIEDVTALDVQRWVNAISKTLQPGTVLKCFRYFSSCIKQAEAWDLIDKAPTQKINLPRKPVKQANFLRQSEVLRVVECARVPESYLFALLAMSGLRLGEGLALKWKDIDFDGNFLKVTQAWGDSGKLTEPKTSTSRRAVQFPPTLRAMLKEFYESSGQPSPDTFLFSATGKQPLDPSNVRAEFYRAITAAKVKRVIIHSLRDTYASTMLSYGASIKALQHSLGHSSPVMTLSVYAHLIPEDISAAMNRADTGWNGGVTELQGGTGVE